MEKIISCEHQITHNRAVVKTRALDDRKPCFMAILSLVGLCFGLIWRGQGVGDYPNFFLTFLLVWLILGCIQKIKFV